MDVLTSKPISKKSVRIGISFLCKSVGMRKFFDKKIPKLSPRDSKSKQVKSDKPVDQVFEVFLLAADGCRLAGSKSMGT